MKHRDFAYKLATLSTKYPRVGCVIVKKKRVLSFAHNIAKSHPFQKQLNLFRFNDNYFDTCKHEQHAEFVAINSIRDKSQLIGSKIIIVRIDRKDNIMPSNPCSACRQLITQYKIKIA